jgi:hypothetical protein
MESFVNYTPESIVVESSNGTLTTFPSIGIVRIKRYTEVFSHHANVKIRRVKWDDVTGLPPYQEGVKVIVVNVVLDAIKQMSNDPYNGYVVRQDLVCPDYGKTAKRGVDGQIVSVTGFVAV